MAVFDDGSGKALYVGGQFTSAGGLAVGRIARWDGTAWSGLDGGVSGGPGGIPAVDALAVFNDGVQESLFVGGSFTQVGDVLANDIATWRGCP
jgi:hypothetical protein